MIKVSQLTKRFGNMTAVGNVSFEVAAGETLILLGTSGCGKTTTLKMLNRLIEPTSGHIEIDGQFITKQAPHELRRKIGYVIQDIGLFPHYTIAENIAIVPTLLRWDKERIRTKTLEILATLRLPPALLNQYPEQLSGGQRQRVGLARALVADPPVVLMDEPLGALDPITRAGIRREFKQLEELKKKTIIMVTHDIQEAFELGDRICLMDKGHIQQIGTANELLRHPANQFVSDFFADQHFYLQLRAFQLKDIATYLPSRSTDLPSDTKKLPAETSLREVTEHLTGANGQLIGFEVDDKFFQADFEALMNAFHRKINE
jgi:osmoprotectant transport system ATP-binding protein